MKGKQVAQIIITADLHFGVPGRLNDILWSARVMREYCKMANIDTVLVLGDLFHDRKSIEIDVLSAVTKFFEEANEIYNQKWIVFPGNHDMFLRHSWDINSLTVLKRHLTVIEDIKILEIDSARFWILPFITYEKPFMKVLSSIESQYVDGDILLTHVGIKGATLNTCFLLKDWSIITFAHSKFKKVYTGHFHSRQQVGDNVYYPGSPIPFKFDEGDVPHGFYHYDTDSKSHKFINIWKAGSKFFPDEIMPPQYYTITEETIDQLSDTDINNGVVRVALQRDYTIDERKKLKEKLLGLGARSIHWMDLTKKMEKHDIIAAAPSRDLFKTWVDNDKNGTKNLNTDVLRRINDEVIQEGDEKYSVEESEV